MNQPQPTKPKDLREIAYLHMSYMHEIIWWLVDDQRRSGQKLRQLHLSKLYARSMPQQPAAFNAQQNTTGRTRLAHLEGDVLRAKHVEHRGTRSRTWGLSDVDPCIAVDVNQKGMNHMTFARWVTQKISPAKHCQLTNCNPYLRS